MTEDPILVHGDALRVLIELPNDCVDREVMQFTLGGAA